MKGIIEMIVVFSITYILVSIYMTKEVSTPKITINHNGINKIYQFKYDSTGMSFITKIDTTK